MAGNSQFDRQARRGQPIPIGYATELFHANWRAATHISLTACSLMFASAMLIVHWPAMFSSGDVSVPGKLRTTLTLVGIAAGLAIGQRTKKLAHFHFADGVLVLAMVVQMAPWLYWLEFDGRISHDLVQMTLPGLSACLCAALFMWWVTCTRPHVTERHLLHQLVAPGNLALCCLYSATIALAMSFTGPLLYGTCLGIICCALSATATLRNVRICDSHLGLLARAPLLVLLGAASCAGGLLGIRTLPLNVVRATTQTVVHFETGHTQNLKVTSAQDGFHVFIGSRLRFSTLDQARWAEALTRPALSRLDCPRRALVFSQGEGLVERELLRDPCIVSIRSVVRDGAIIDAARREHWWRKTTDNAWQSPRVVAEEMDPARWLMVKATEPFDLVIVDLPDPDDFINAKYYTRFFYRKLRQRLRAGAMVVVQATSAFRSPSTFANIRATLEAAGFVTVPYRAAMPTLGEWTFLLAQSSAISAVVRPQWLAGVAVGARDAFALAPDAVPKVPGQVSRLDEPFVLDAFLNEGGEHDP